MTEQHNQSPAEGQPDLPQQPARYGKPKASRILPSFAVWAGDKILPLVLGSLIIAGALAAYQQKSELAKLTFQTEYKEVKAKYRECSALHRDYLQSLSLQAGNAEVLHRFFNPERIAVLGQREEYFVLFKHFIEQSTEAANKRNGLFAKVSHCYRELHSLYDDLAILLGDDVPATDSQPNEGAAEVDRLVNERAVLVRELEGRVDMEAWLLTLAGGGDMSQINALYKKANFKDLSSIWAKTAEIENNILANQQKEFTVKSALFAESLRKRFDRGIIRSLGDILY